MDISEQVICCLGGAPIGIQYQIMERFAFRILDLPDELVINILGRLNAEARARFSAVCKPCKLLFQRLLPLLPEANQFPWFLEFEEFRIGWPLEFFKPCFASQQETCGIIHRTLEKEQIEAISPSTIARRIMKLQCTEFGWLVFKSEDSGTLDLFLYSPSTETVISLPRLPFGEIDGFAMSHPPSCSDCVFIVFCFSTIFSYQRGDKNWKHHYPSVNFEELDDWLVSVVNVAFHAGIFYCLFEYGELGAFDTISGSWRTLLPEFDEDGPTSYSAYYLAKSDGDLLMVHHFLMSSPSRRSCSVWKYEEAEGGWRKMETLGGRVVFLTVGEDNDCLSSGNLVMAAAGDLEGLANRIYFSDLLIGYFSLSDGEFHVDHSLYLFDKEISLHHGSWMMPPHCKFEVVTVRGH